MPNFQPHLFISITRNQLTNYSSHAMYNTCQPTLKTLIKKNTINPIFDCKHNHGPYKTTNKKTHYTMKHSKVEHTINTILHQKKQMTKSIRILKRNIRSAKAIQENLAKTFTEAPHFLNYAISAQISDTEDAFNTKANNIVITLEEEINETITTQKKVLDNLSVK